MEPQNILYHMTCAPKYRTSASYRKLIRTTFLKYTPMWITADSIDVQWAIFVNYSLPGHMIAVNNDGADRKLWAETGEGMDKVSLN